MSALDEILSRFDKLSSDDQQAVIDLADTTKGMLWVPNPGPQTDAYFSKADLLLYGGAGGGGKMQPVDSPVLTPFGWKPIGSLKVGSKICATDGTVTEVIGVYPQGDVDIYRVTFEDGGSTEAGLEHNWLAWCGFKSLKSGNSPLSGEASARKWTTAQMIDQMNSKRSGRVSMFIPVTDPVAFNVAGQLKGQGNFVSRPVDPYLLGLLIGDGHYSGKHIGLTSADQEILDYAHTVSNGEACTTWGKGRSCAGCNFKGEFKIGIDAALRDLGMRPGRAADKFIPRQYLLAPVADRWALLQGLMDSDGWVEPKRCCYYLTISERLRDDVAHLARSLGAVVSICEKSPTYTSNGKKLKGQKAYCLRIKLKSPADCFRLTRKKVVASEINHQSMGRRVEKIEFSRKAEAVCIGVAHPNSLYITDDFIVTHNTDLGLGLAITEHQRSLVMRRQYTDLTDMIDRSIEIAGTNSGLNRSPPPRFTIGDKTIQFGAVAKAGDEQNWQGRARDLLYCDEAAHFLEAQIRFLMGWVRSAKKDLNGGKPQRSRTVLGSNPPISAQGDWLIKMFRPWLDLTHPDYPAKHGVLRWYIQAPDGEEIEVPDASPVDLGGRTVMPKSRTFIPAKLQDNPYLIGTDYEKEQDALPEPYLSAIRDGNFMAARADQNMQIIPSDWIFQAQNRWKEQAKERGGPIPPLNMGMSSMGADVAFKHDNAVLARRYGAWFDQPIRKKGSEVGDSMGMAAFMLTYIRDGALMVIDMGGGYGEGAYTHLHNQGFNIVPYLGSGASTGRTESRKFKFANKRTQELWRMREALDPNLGIDLALPPDALLSADLSAPTYEIRGDTIYAETKQKVCDRLGRSTDTGDAYVMALSEGEEPVTAKVRVAINGGLNRKLPSRANISKPNAKRYARS